MAKPGKKNGVISHFGAPASANDFGINFTTEKKLVELHNHRKTVQIPRDYDSKMQIARHPEKSSIGTTNYIDPLVIKAAVVEPTDALIPGAKYDIRFYAINGKLSSVEALRFLREQRSLQIGVPGLSVIFSLMKGSLPFDRWIVALDDRSHLYKDEFESYRVPMIIYPLMASSSFLLGHFDHVWQNRQVLISAMRIG